MCVGKNTENETFTLKDSIMNNSKEEKILRVTIENRLTFNSHIRELCDSSKNIPLCQEYQTNLMILKKPFFLTL